MANPLLDNNPLLRDNPLLYDEPEQPSPIQTVKEQWRKWRPRKVGEIEHIPGIRAGGPIWMFGREEKGQLTPEESQAYESLVARRITGLETAGSVAAVAYLGYMGLQGIQGLRQFVRIKRSISAPYRELGLKSTATIEQVNKTYRGLALKFHPDRPTGNLGKFQRINAAYQNVMDMMRPEAKQPMFKYQMALLRSQAGLARPFKPKKALVPKIPTPPKAIPTIPKLGIEPVVAMITPQQIKQIHIKAREIGLIKRVPEGIKDTQYKRFLKAYFPEVYGIEPGLKRVTAKSLTQEQATRAIEMMAFRPGQRRFKIPTTKAIIPGDFAERIPGLKEIGLKERFRPAWRVFEKIGLYKEVFEPAFETEVKIFEDLMKFRNDALIQKRLVARVPDSSRRMFQYVNKTLPRGEVLTPAEIKVANWGKKFYDDWANRLKLPAHQRRKDYITHIFEAEISKAIKERHPIDPDLIRALDFITPKTVFNPFLQHRMGITTGLKEDFWSAIEAYEGRELKVFHYQPLIQKVRIYERFLPPNSARYLRNFITRITNRPLVVDKEIQQDFKELAGVIKKLPKGELLAEHLTKGNVGGMMAYNFTGLLYEAYLGLRPSSAIKNLSQNALTISEVGPKSFAQGKVWKLTAEGKQMLRQSLLLRSRKLGYLPGVDESFIRGLESKRRKVTMRMFRLADQENVENAFAAGCMEAKNLGLPKEWWARRGDEVAMKTQYVYTKLAGAQWSQVAPGRVLGVLTTWPENWAELMNDWIWAKPSQVYLDYEKMTRERVIPDSPIKKRKALWRYLALVLLAHYVQKKTRLKALYYTGWTSIQSIANLTRGEFAGLKHIGALASLLAAISMGDTKRIKQYARQLRPDQIVIIVKQLEDIASGKKDWLSLFFLLKPKEKPTIKRPSVRYYKNPLLHD